MQVSQSHLYLVRAQVVSHVGGTQQEIFSVPSRQSPVNPLAEYQTRHIEPLEGTSYFCDQPPLISIQVRLCWDGGEKMSAVGHRSEMKCFCFVLMVF